MRKRLIPGLLALCLCVGLMAPIALARERTMPMPFSWDEIASRLLDAAFHAETPAEQIGLVFMASRAGRENPDILTSCAQLIYYLDIDDLYAAECETMLRSAISLSEGAQKVNAMLSLSTQLSYWERTDEAVSLLYQVIDLSPDNDQALLTLAQTLSYLDRNEEALALLETFLERKPVHLDAQRLHAAILLTLYRYDDAIAAYKKVETDWPEYLEGSYGLFMAYTAAGEFDKGIRELDKVLANGGDDDALWLERARIRLWKQYRPEVALKETEALLRMDPEWIDAMTVKLVSLIMLERYDEAYEVVDQAEAVDTSYAQLLKSIVLMNERKWKEAESTLNRLLKTLDSSPLVYLRLATISLDGWDDADGALDMLKKAFVLAENEIDSDLLMILGHAYRRNGSLLDAARAFYHADSLSHEDPTALYYLAVTCLDAGRNEDAAQALAELEKRYPGWFETFSARILIADSENNAQDALDAFDALSEKFPFPVASLEELRWMLTASSGDDAGAENLKAMIEENGEPDSVLNHWDSLAFSLMRLGRIEEAREACAEAERLLDANSEDIRNADRISVLTTKGEILLRDGAMEESLSAFGEAVDAGWQPYPLLTSDDYAPLRKLDSFGDVITVTPYTDAEWDLSPMPKIP